MNPAADGDSIRENAVQDRKIQSETDSHDEIAVEYENESDLLKFNWSSSERREENINVDSIGTD